MTQPTSVSTGSLPPPNSFNDYSPKLTVFSPPLDTAGNSVRCQQVARFLSEGLGLNLYASRPA